MRLRAPLLVTAAAALAVVAGALHVAQADDPPPTGAPLQEEPAYAVEDFAYPQAARIQEERGFQLKRGDGHIVLTECGEEGLLRVEGRVKEGGLQESPVCFRVTGSQGYLSMEIPSVYRIVGNDYYTTARMTAGDGEVVCQIGRNTGVGVGEGQGPGQPEETLLELVTSDEPPEDAGDPEEGPCQ